MKELTGLNINPTFTDQHQPGTFNFQMKITAEREMMESIRKLEKLHLFVANSYWSILEKNFKLGEEPSLTRSRLYSFVAQLKTVRDKAYGIRHGAGPLIETIQSLLDQFIDFPTTFDAWRAELDLRN